MAKLVVVDSTGFRQLEFDGEGTEPIECGAVSTNAVLQRRFEFCANLQATSVALSSLNTVNIWDSRCDETWNHQNFKALGYVELLAFNRRGNRMIVKTGQRLFSGSCHPNISGLHVYDLTNGASILWSNRVYMFSDVTPVFSVDDSTLLCVRKHYFTSIRGRDALPFPVSPLDPKPSENEIFEDDEKIPFDNTYACLEAETGNELLHLKTNSHITRLTAHSNRDSVAIIEGSAIVIRCPKTLIIHGVIHPLHPFKSICFSNDGERILVGDLNARITVWDVSSGVMVFEIPTQYPIHSWLCSSSCGRWIAFRTMDAKGCEEMRVHVCDAASGREVTNCEGSACAFNQESVVLL